MRKDKGFVLITVLLLLVLLAVTALVLNSRSGLQNRMSANQTQAAQNYLNQLSVIEKGIWKLSQNPGWRPTEADPLFYNGAAGTIDYSRTDGYTDALTISVRTPGMLSDKKGLPASFWYYINTLPIAGLSETQKIAVYYDPSGNQGKGAIYLYIADTGNNRILKVDLATNAVTTVAGIGGPGGYSGDGPAEDARLNKPNGIYVDGTSGDIYVADTENCIIRKINMSAIPKPTITRIAGREPPDNCSFNEGAATNARFDKPSGLFKSGADIYVADTNNNRIRKFQEGGAVVTIAGSGGPGTFSGDGGAATLAQLNRPTGVHVDKAGNIFIADKENSRIRKVSVPQPPDTVWRITTITDGLNQPTEVLVDDSGALLIAESGNNAVRLVTGVRSTTLAGTPPGCGFSGDNGPAVDAKLWSPGGIALSGSRGGGKIYISDTANNRIRVLSLKKVKELY